MNPDLSLSGCGIQSVQRDIETAPVIQTLVALFRVLTNEKADREEGKDEIWNVERNIHVGYVRVVILVMSVLRLSELGPGGWDLEKY